MRSQMTISRRPAGSLARPVMDALAEWFRPGEVIDLDDLYVIEDAVPEVSRLELGKTIHSLSNRSDGCVRYLGNRRYQFCFHVYIDVAMSGCDALRPELRGHCGCGSQLTTAGTCMMGCD